MSEIFNQCPFCGGDAYSLPVGLGDGWIVGCDREWCYGYHERGGLAFETREKAQKAWDIRESGWFSIKERAPIRDPESAHNVSVEVLKSNGLSVWTGRVELAVGSEDNTAYWMPWPLGPEE